MIKDWRGNEIKIGSTIVYPGRSGSSMWMTEAKVIDIQHKAQFPWEPTPVPILKIDVNGVITTIKRIDRVTVVEQEKIKYKVNYNLEDLKDIK